MLVEDLDGIVPQTFEELEKLPGVGHKTASVVICTAFGYAAVLHTCDVCNISLVHPKERVDCGILNQD